MMKCCGGSSRNSIFSKCAMRVRSRVAGGSPEMKLFCALLISLVLAPAGFPQAKPAQTKAADADRLGLTCTQILQMTSAAWVAQFAEKARTSNNAAGVPTVRAITVYGKCYEARTSQGAADGRAGKLPRFSAGVR